jgi:hypothetical protein
MWRAAVDAAPSLPDLHDKVLKSVRVDWHDGVVELQFVSLMVRCSGVQLARVPRLQAWGMSDQCNAAHVVAEGGRWVLQIEMQSGDVIEVLCASIVCDQA